MILELLAFGGFFAHFDLAGLNQRPNSQRNSPSSGEFLILELAIPGGRTLPW
jgi:hypothetical protein